LILAILLGGCISPWGTNLQSDQKRQLEESRATEAVAETSTRAEGPPPVVVNQGDSSTATIAPPAPVKYSHQARKGIGENRAMEASTSAWLSQKNPWTLILYGAGLILVVFALKKLWGLVKGTALGHAARAADQATRRLIDELRRKMQTETDPTKLNALKDAVLDAEANLGG